MILLSNGLCLEKLLETSRAKSTFKEPFNVASEIFSVIGGCKSSMLDSNSIKNLIEHYQYIIEITLCPSGESTETYHEAEIYDTAPCLFDDAMAEYSAMQILNRVFNNAKLTKEQMIGGKRLFDKETCERFEGELQDNGLYLLNKTLTADRLTATGNLDMRSEELFACVMELIDDIRNIHKSPFPLPASTLLCEIFSKIISETKPSNGAVCGDRQVETYDDKIGDETVVAKNIKVLIGMPACIILRHADIEEYYGYADNLSEYCRGLHPDLANKILLSSTQGYLAIDKVMETVKTASRVYVGGDSHLSRYLLTGKMDAADSEALPGGVAKQTVSIGEVGEAFMPLREEKCKQGYPIINAELFKKVVSNFHKWYNEGKNLSISKIKTQADTVMQLIEICKKIKKNIDKKPHKLTAENFECFLKAQFSDFDSRKKSFLNH